MTTADWDTVATPDGPMRIFTAVPGDGPPRGTVLVLQEAFGVNQQIREVTRRVAAAGYRALAPDLFHRTGAGELGYDQYAEAMSLIAEIGPGEIITDLRAVLQAAPGDDATAVIGFCFGGRAAFTTATAFPVLRAAVVFYGPGIAAGPHAVLNQARMITAPVLLHTGTEDRAIPAEQAAATDRALQAAGVRFESYAYPGAGHAFACEARPDWFRPDSARQAWDRTFRFLGEHLRPGRLAAGRYV